MPPSTVKQEQHAEDSAAYAAAAAAATPPPPQCGASDSVAPLTAAQERMLAELKRQLVLRQAAQAEQQAWERQQRLVYEQWERARVEDQLAWERRRAERRQQWLLQRACEQREFEEQQAADLARWEEHRRMQQALWQRWQQQHCGGEAAAAADASRKRRREPMCNEADISVVAGDSSEAEQAPLHAPTSLRPTAAAEVRRRARHALCGAACRPCTPAFLPPCPTAA